MKVTDLNSSEYLPYYKRYIDLAEDNSLLDALNEGLRSTFDFFSGIPDTKMMYQYAAGKWTPKEILLHLIDTERVFVYRALYFARNEGSELKGFDENIFAANSEANNRSLEDLLNEYKQVRLATINFFRSLSTNTLIKSGSANGSIMSVRACGFVICGHEIHHANVIKERYL